MQDRQTYWRVFVKNLNVLCWKPGDYVKKVLIDRKKKFPAKNSSDDGKNSFFKNAEVFCLMSQLLFVESQEVIKTV